MDLCKTCIVPLSPGVSSVRLMATIGEGLFSAGPSFVEYCLIYKLPVDLKIRILLL